MDLTVHGDVQQDAHTEREVPAARDLTVDYRQAAGVGPQDRESLPTDQVVVGDIPLEPPGFLRRAALLAELDRGDARVSVIDAATGLQGSGATHLAAAYARAKLADGWRLVAWVNGSDTGSTMAGLTAVADATGLIDSDSGRGTADAARAVRYWLETDGDRCLLVFDDVTDPEQLRPFIPVGGAAKVLITCARQSALNLGRSVPVNVFSAADAAEFLDRSTGLADAEGAAAVAAELGQLPLALAHAAAVMAGQGLTYWAYLDRLRALSAHEDLAEDEPQSHRRDVAAAVKLSLQAVRASDRTGVCSRAMEIMAVLSAAGVRRDLLHVAGRAGVLHGGRRVAPAVVDRALEWLSRRSLLVFSLDGQTVIVHRLVAQAVRDSLVRRQRLMAVRLAATFVLDTYARSLVGSQDRPAVRGIPQHVQALLDSMAEPSAAADVELTRVLLRLRFIALYHLIELRDSAPQAIVIGEPLTADLERLLGADHPDTLNSRNSLAAAYLAVGRTDAAIPLFEQILAARQRMLGSDHPDTLNSQNNLAAAYQDAGRAADAIPLYEANLAVRERLLSAGHPSTLNSLGNLAAAYLDAGRAAEAIPLFEKTLAEREQVLGPDHPDTRASRKNLAAAYQHVGLADKAVRLLGETPAGRQKLAAAYRDGARAVEVIPPVEQTLTAQTSQPDADAADQVLASFRRPPAGPARRPLPAGFRRPPADPARQAFPKSFTLPTAKPAAPARPVPSQAPPPQGFHHDREVVAAIAAGDPAGIAMAYDRYAPAIYGYCHWMLRDPADAAAALQDTFVLTATTFGDRSDASKLRPCLYAIARRECRRRPLTVPAARDEQADTAHQPAEPVSDPAVRPPAVPVCDPADATVQFPAVRPPAVPVCDPADATVQFPAVRPPAVPVCDPADATVQFPAVRPPAVPVCDPADATVQFPAVRPPAVPVCDPADATVQFQAVRPPAVPVSDPADATVQFRAVRTASYVVPQMLDATMPFPAIRPRPESANSLPHVGSELGRAELQALIRSLLADLTPREREAIELNFRHDLHDNDLAMALGVSWSRAHARVSRAHARLDQGLAALRIALTGRDACPVLAELLADWDGQLTEEVRDLVSWHIGECQTCANHKPGALRPAAFSHVLPLAPLPLALREQILSRCTSTTEAAVAYRRRLARRAEPTWFTEFWQAIRRVNWDSIRSNPGAVIAAAAVTVWVVAAVSVTLLVFAGSHPAQAAQPPARTSSSSPAAVTSTAAVPATRAAIRTSPAAQHSTPVNQPPAYVPPPVPQSPSYSPTVSPSPSPSAKPSTSPSASSSPKPSSSATTSPSSSPSPAA